MCFHRAKCQADWVQKGANKNSIAVVARVKQDEKYMCSSVVLSKNIFHLCTSSSVLLLSVLLRVSFFEISGIFLPGNGP
jgi:hypothetical protein